jgi:malate synthase
LGEQPPSPVGDPRRKKALSSLEIHDEVNVQATSLPGEERVLAGEALSFVARPHHEFGPRHRNLLRRRYERHEDLRADATSRFLGELELYAPARESYVWEPGEEPQLKQRDREDARMSARDQMDVRTADIRVSQDQLVLNEKFAFWLTPSTGNWINWR